ncbi:MAG TPA: TAXI family TRAP transporter solute-binding subunit [Candidatus Dormibacteraeota bacterium]|nr:TAXI family TRAP transporter solute-binding subunit [Candidatus Dormibacteraeota bacterium]
MMRKIAAFAVAAVIALAACQAPRAGGQPSGSAGASATPNFAGKTLNLATGPAGGVYIVYGAGIADVLSKRLGVTASPQVTPASVDNMKLIRDGKADLALTLSDTAFDAVKGQATFAPPEKPVPAKALAVMYTNFTHVVVRDGIGVSTVADLKGKRVSVGAAGSGTEIIANRVLEAYGMTQADLSAQKLAVQASADALRDGKIDAFFWSGGLPTAAVIDLVNAASVKVKLLDHTDILAKMQQKYPGVYYETKIAANTYKNDKEVKVIGVANLLVVPATFDKALAKAILATLFDAKADLAKIHAEANNLTLENASKGSPIDYHEGAIEFYKEKGVMK